MDLSPTKTDGIVFLYNFALVVAAGYALRQVDIDDTTALFGVAFVLALVWTVYFRYDMQSRMAYGTESDAAEEAEGAE